MHSDRANQHPRRAFPNAYIDTDEPPKRLPWSKMLALVGAAGTAWFGLTILILTFIDGEFSPISQAASDYGVGSYALEMNLGFFIGGIGVIAFAIANVKQEGRKSRAATVLFLIAGAVLIMDSYFTTNIEGGPSTFHGLIHGFGGFIFFITAPIGTLLVSRKISRARVIITLASLLVGFTLLAANVNLSGLAERIILLVIFGSVISVSANLFRSA